MAPMARDSTPFVQASSCCRRGGGRDNRIRGVDIGAGSSGAPLQEPAPNAAAAAVKVGLSNLMPLPVFFFPELDTISTGCRRL